MTAHNLIDVLLPIYDPCRHFTGQCAGACIWNPEDGRVPCAFGGATGETEDVQLVIVTAEPGDPPRNAGYHGTPRDMLRNSLDIFDQAIRDKKIERERATVSAYTSIPQLDGESKGHIYRS